ncbi:MAG: hypothetical protein PF693_14320, partial [Spirochaetia bacterium]|nr:hypothetical protein [Spirochaetia bacterium]
MLRKANLVLLFLFFYLPNTVFCQEVNLVEDTLYLDISTTSYYDLVIWADELGLKPTGGINDLKTMLYSHYNLEEEIKKNEISEGRSIIIESANELNYIENIEIDQNYIILQGEVKLEMIDFDNETSHKITADKIVFNQSDKTISASGNIIYEIQRVEDVEFFYGESLVFEIETWEGIFFQGVSEKNRTVENKDLNNSEDIKFFFSGENIYRGSNDSIELNNGSITSSKSKDPYYRIDADKIWILSPGEWAIKNAVLYVGRIPILYIPFFFLPGDELVFNPAAGYKEIEGYFMNTTTYILGAKNESEEDNFSFLKSNNDDSDLKIKYREGLFLRSSELNMDKNQWPYNNGSYIKMFVDYYTRKGFFLGIDGTLNYDKLLKNIDIFTGFSVSRHLFLDNESGVYTPLRVDSLGLYVSDYEKSYFFGFNIPFRFAFDLDINLETNWGKLNFDLPIYSDTKFRSHFLNREEGVKWTELINTKDTLLNKTENEMTSLSWNITGNLNPSIPILAPLVETLSLDKINIKLNWLSSVIDHPENTLLTDNNYTFNDHLYFYYPSSLTFPDISGKISGTIFKSKDPQIIDSNIINTELFLNLIDPLKDKEDVSNKTEYEGLIDPPEMIENFNIDIQNKPNQFTNSLKYSIIPSFSLNSLYSTEIPETSLDINYESDYSILSAQTTSSLDYSLNIYDSLFDFSNISIFSMNYKEHIDSSVEVDVWNSYILQDKNSTNYKLTDNIELSSKPFINNKILDESVFTYTLNTTLYNRYWDSVSENYDNYYFLWNKESINIHQASLVFKFYDSINYQTIKLDTILPPENLQLFPEVIFYFGKFISSIKTEFHLIEDQPNSYWLHKPYIGYIQYNFYDKDFFKQTLSIDFDQMENSFARTELSIDKLDSNVIMKENLDIDLNSMSFTKSSTDIQLWFLTFNYLMEDIIGSYFLLPKGWLPESESQFQASKASAAINYKYNPDPFWKNRIQLSFDIISTWTMNLQKYTDTSFTFDLNFSLYIAEFTELVFKSKSVNRATYRYIPGNSSEIGLPDLNIFSDLLKSFNFFSNEDREASNFNLENIGISVIHHLSDWDLSFEYSGEPVLVTVDDFPEYQWKSNFSLFVTWKPVPEIKKNINYS